MKKSLPFIYLVLVFWSCSKEEIGPLDLYGEAYFPLHTGNFVIYNVDHTVYDLNGETQSIYQLKESVVDSFASISGIHIYTIHRERWNDAEQQWKLIEAWSARLENNEAVVAQGTIQYLKLKLPLSKDKSWDGNIYNIEEEEMYQADSLGLDYQVQGGEVISNSITVIQKNNLDKIVETDYRIEKYAPNIGLIYKEITNLEYCTSNDDCLGQQIIEQGQIYKQTILSFGNE